MGRQLNLDRDKLDQCYEISSRIISHASKYLDRHSSFAIERATLMFLGVGGYYRGIPLASHMVSRLSKDQLRLGAAFWWGRALLATKEEPGSLALRLARGKIRWNDLPEIHPGPIKKETERLALEGFQNISDIRKNQEMRTVEYRNPIPLIAIRLEETKAKRLKIGVEEWFKQEAALGVVHFHSDKFSKDHSSLEEIDQAWQHLKEGRILVTASGLSIPEQTLIAIKHGIKAILLEGWRSLLNHEIDSKRGLIDLGFALWLAAKFPIKILGDHSFLCAKESGGLKSFQLLSLLLLFEQLAARKGCALEDVMLATSPSNGEVARPWSTIVSHTQVLREMFPQSPLWYRLSGHMDPLHFFVASFTEQDVVELEVKTRSPLFRNFDEMLKRAKEWLLQGEGFGKELSINTLGKIAREGHLLLEQTWKLLKRIEHLTLWKALEEDLFKTKTREEAPAGRDGVFQKSYHYWNPVIKL